MPRWPILSIAALVFAAPAARAQLSGNALSLSGDDQYACTDVAIGQPAQLTFEAWVRVPVDATHGVIVGNHYHGVLWESVEFWSNQFIITSSNSSAARQEIQYNYPNDGQWHHVAAVWDGANQWACIDGQLASGPQAAPLGPWASTQPLCIGGRVSVDQPLAVSELQGLIDELRIWTVARTPGQIQSTMHQTLGPEYYASADSSLWAYWRFDQLEDLGVGTAGTNDVRDLAVTGAHADVVGAALTHTVSVPAARLESRIELAAYPNPTPANSTVRFVLPTELDVDLAVYDLGGRRVRTLMTGPQREGPHAADFDGRDAIGRALPNGRYFVRLNAGSRTRTVGLTLRH